MEGDAKDNINAPWCDRILLHSDMRMVLALFEVSGLRVCACGGQYGSFRQAPWAAAGAAGQD